MVREILKIYTDNGLGSNNPKFKDIEISEYQYKSSRMGMPELTATLMWGTCLDEEWTGKEYVVLNSERFYIRHTPSSSKSNTDARYKHDISFTSEVAEILGNTYYEDAVPSYSATYDKPCTNSTKFTFYGTIHEFCARLNCGFIKAGIGDTILDTKTKLTPDDKPIGDGYCVIVDEAGIADPDKTYNFEWEDKYLWEAITEGYTVTEIPFERRGKEIIFGAVPVVVEHKFKYGHDNELLSVSKKNANAKVVNRITMSGSSENIPYYYPNETEYGHISISEKTGNNVLTADKISIENTAQMLSRINAGQMAVLKKYEKNKDDEYDTAVVIKSYASAIESDVLEPYTLGDTLKFEHKPYGWGEPYKFWNIQVNFEVLSRGFVTCDSVAYQVWMKLQSPVLNSLGPLPVSLTNLDNMTLRDVTNGKDISEQIRIKDEGTSFGILTEGDYEFKFSVRIEEGHAGSPVDADFFCYLESVTLSFEKNKPAEKEGYYWAVGDKEYAGVGSLGVKISIPITDDMIGDGFGWEASGRMPFQTNLVPPKFRSTLGAERFYNAINNTYNDPDTGNKYTFPNPFVKGAPNEYIHKNEDAKPTIEGVCNAVQRRGTNNNLVYDDNGNPVYQLLGEIADIAYDADDNDSLKADSSEENDKNDSLKYEHSFFYIKLNIFNGTYGFDLFKHASQTDAMTIQMREGSCNGCKFKIQAVRFTDETGLETYKNPVIVRNGVPVGVVSEKGIKESDLDPTQQNTQTNSIWICVQKDAETFGVIMPNKSHIFKPKVGDKFNIINIDLPQAYILAAEQRLEDEGIRFMADNNEEKFTFDISASRIFFADNPTILAQIDEYSKIKVEYNGKTYEQYVNQLSIDCKNNETLPNIGIDLTDTLAVGQSFLDSVAERASSLVSNATTMGGNIGGGGGMSATVADRRYISKQKSDRTPYKVASDTAFEVGEFINGASGAILMRDPVTGQTYLEVDKIRARMKAIFAELEIAKENSIGGAFDITPGGGINITFVEELTDSYRCYFKAREEDKGADCRFVVGDQARCSERNISNGLINDASNRYYWRLVTAVNNRESYIDLSKADCDAGSDAPVAGDTVVHLGNRNNKERQSAIVLSTVDASAPSVTLYNGIDHYSLDGKAVVEYGVDKSKNPPEPFFNCYGRFYFGPKGGNSYLKFEPSVGKLIFSGELINISHLNGKELDQYIKDVVPPVTQEDIEGYVNAIVDPQIENIQNQIDGVIETWFYNGVPTLSNYPASEWNTDALKIAHLGDLYYDNDTGTAYRFSQDNNGNYYWNTITDDAITKALAAAKNAQDTADGKRRTFTAQPVPPYDEGDIWTNATYGTYSNDILRCITKKAKGEAFNISDWTLASKYTDDSALNTFIQGYESTIGDIKTQIDGKAQTWYQATDPSSAWKTDAQKAEHKGDLWYNTTNGTTWYWDGSQWKQQDVPDAVFDKIDGKADIFVSKPTGGYHQNDLWFLEADYTLSDGAHKAGTLAVALHDMGASFNFNDWAKKDRYTDDTKANQAIEEIGGYQYLKQAIANGASLFQGGLILSGLIKLGEWDLTDRNNPVQTEVWAGMNGIYNHHKTIASWWGGDMVDKFYNDSVTPRPTPLASGYAQALIRMDGTGYLAGGNIKWDSDGSGSVAGGNISWNALGSLTLGNGIKIDLGSGNETTLGGIQASLESITNLLAKFSDNFVPMVRLANGNVVETNWGNINNNNPLYAVKSVKGFYSEEFISARGKNDNGSQGGATQLRMLEDVNINDNALASGQSLVYDGSKWVNMKAGLNTTELAQYLTDNNYAKKSDMPTLAGYATEQWVTAKGYITATALNGYATQQWVDDKGYALDSVLTAHTGNTTIHITSAERTLWNQTATNLSTIIGSDTDTVINKFEEIVAFLATYTEADTLANLLSNKADKTTSISAGTGLSGGGTLASDITLYLATSGVTAGTYTKLTVDAYGRATSGAFLVASDIPSLDWSKITTGKPTTLDGYGIQSDADGRYVNVDGDTMTGLLTANGGITVPSTKSITIGECVISWDGTGLKFSKGIYSDSFVSARGANSSAGSGSVGVDADEVNNLISTYLTNYQYAKQSWVEGKGYLTAITKAQVEGVLTGNISTHTHSYLPLTGGTLTGRLKITTNSRSTSFGCDDALYSHYRTDADLGHWFDKRVYVRGEIYAGTNYSNLVWHSGNDGSGSGLDADLLDGVEGSYYLREAAGYSGCGVNNAISWINGQIDPDTMGQLTSAVATFISFGNVEAGHKAQLLIGKSTFKVRACYGNTDNANWKDFAFLDSNVASATKLQTSRTIWGQSFDGSGNVDGTIHVKVNTSGYTEGIRLYGSAKDSTWSNINFGCNPSATAGTHENQWILGRNTSNNFVLDVNGSSGNIMTWLKNGNIGMGITNPTYKLDVNGDIRSNGWLRTTGAYGWHSETYGGGWFMQDTTWIRGYGNKSLYMGNGIIRTETSVQIGECVLSWDSANQCLRISTGVYSDSFVSAKGINPDGASGGGLIHSVYGFGDLNGTYDDSNLTDTFNAFTIKSIYNGLQTHTHPQYLTTLPTRLSQYITSDLSDGNGFGRLVSNTPFLSLNSSSYDCMLITTAYSDIWRGELALDYRTNNIAYRNKNNGTWNEWAMMLSNKNFSSYFTIPTDTAQLSNGAGFITNSAISDMVTKSGAQTISGAKTFTDIRLSGQPENPNMPFFLGIDSYADGGAIKYIGASKVCNAIGALPSSSYNASDILAKLLTVDGAGSGLDADKLDGCHNGEVDAIKVVTQFTGANFDPNTIITNGLRGSSANADTASLQNAPTTYGSGEYWVENKSCNGYGSQTLFMKSGLNIWGLWMRPHNNTSTFGSWKQFAFTDSNVYSASKLQTARSIWGQSFDGSGNVSGDMSGVGSITMNGNLTNTYRGNGTYSKFVVEFGTMAINVEAPLSVNDISSDPIPVNFGWRGGSYALTLASNKNVGIDTANPDYKLDVNGDIRSNGWLRTTGDAGWYSQTYGGGWRMTDTTWIRTYGGKSIYHDSGILRTDGILQVGNGGERFIVTDTGAVGIGTNNPVHKLHVNGGLGLNGNIYNYATGDGGYNSFSIEFKSTGINIKAPRATDAQTADPIPINFGWQSRGTSYALTLAANKNVGIGTTSPAYKLHVNGVAYASTGIFSNGYVSARGQNTSSDIRLKTNLTPFELALHQIANAPSVNFDWLEGSHDVGSIAQYWESVNPILTPKDPDGYLTLQYGKTALLSVITVAKETERLIVKADNHEERISRLEQSNRDLKRDNKALRQENKELKNKIFELERR